MNVLSRTVFFVLVLAAPYVTPHKHGAPTSVCQSLLPKHHGIPPKPLPAPYRIEVSSPTIGQGQTLGLKIIGDPVNLPFEGYIIQARSLRQPTQIIGTFNRVHKSKLMDCGDGTGNSLTHEDNHPKTDYYIEWNAPTDFTGEVFFNSTVLAKFDKFWTGILSEKVNVVQGQFSNQNTPRLAQVPFATTETTFVRPTSRVVQPQDPIYNGCGQNKNCFGLPDNCIDRMSCTIFSSVKVRGSIFEIEMKTTDPDAAYVSMGFSDDARMGDDLVTECVKNRGEVSVFSSYTSGSPNYGTSRIGVPQNDAQLLEGQINNGQIYCRVQRSPETTTNGRTFNLATQKYNLLVAAGKSLKENGAGYHDIGRNPSSQAINLAVVQELTSSSNLLIRLHGAFMIFAWIGTTSLGILIARYFKQTWVGSQMCGKDMWFAWHRMCMVTTWSLTIAAFILIFVQLKGWSGEQNPHAILGTITTVICFLQPIGALFRPAPNASTRPLFNWIHWLGGNAAHILSIVTIFYAVKLTKAQLPGWFDWILVAFVIFHVAIHLLYSCAACLSDKKTSNRVSTFEMNDRSNGRKSKQNSSGNKMSAAYASFRKGLLGAYVFILLIFIVIFIVIIVLAPIEDTLKSIKSKVMN